MRLTHSLYEKRKRSAIRLTDAVEAVLVKVSVAAALTGMSQRCMKESGHDKNSNNKGGHMKEYQPEMEQFERDIKYYEAHWEALLKQYPEQWVAVLNEEVVGASPDPYELIDDLKGRGIPTERVVIEHLTRQEELLIL